MSRFPDRSAPTLLVNPAGAEPPTVMLTWSGVGWCPCLVHIGPEWDVLPVQQELVNTSAEFECPRHRVMRSVVMQDSALDSLVAARHAVLADLAQSARPGTPAEADAAFRHGNPLPAATMSASSSRGTQPVLDPLMQARALVRSAAIRQH